MGLDIDDWGRWVHGLVGAGISGAASSLSSGVGATMLAPETFNMNEGFGKLIKMVAITATVSFIVSISKYLSQKPLPEDDCK